MTLKPIEIAPESDNSLDRVLQSVKENCKAGFAVAVIKEGRLLKREYFGLADTSHNVPVDQDTKFVLASISKMFTSMAILHLVEQGIIDLEKPLNHYIPELQKSGGLSVRKVLSMTSGLCDTFEMFLFSGIGNLVGHSFEDHVLASEIFAQEEKVFADHFIYSNTGYIFLATLVERVTAKNFEDAIQEIVLAPLGMNSTDSFDKTWRVVEKMAMPNVVKSGSDENYIGRMYRDMAGAGHLVSTLDDMIKFAAALSNLSLNNVDMRKLYERPQLQHNQPSFYGLGLQVLPLNERLNIFGHNGAYYGVKTACFVEPQSQTACVFLSNDHDINALKWTVELISAASGKNLSFDSLKQDSSPIFNEEHWLSKDTGLAITLHKREYPEKIEFYGEEYDLIFIGENKYMVPYTVSSVFLEQQQDGNYDLTVGGYKHNLSPVSAFDKIPANHMEYVGRYKNPNSDIEISAKINKDKGLSLQFGLSFNAVHDSPLEPIAKDYYSCEITEDNGTPLTVYVRFEREQFSQMISGFRVHSMRTPELTFRRLKTV